MQPCTPGKNIPGAAINDAWLFGTQTDATLWLYSTCITQKKRHLWLGLWSHDPQEGLTSASWLLFGLKPAQITHCDAHFYDWERPFLFLPTQWLLLLGQRPFVESPAPPPPPHPGVTITHEFQANIDERLCSQALSVIITHFSQPLCCLQLFMFTVGDKEIWKGNFLTQILEQKSQQSEVGRWHHEQLLEVADVDLIRSTFFWVNDWITVLTERWHVLWIPP